MAQTDIAQIKLGDLGELFQGLPTSGPTTDQSAWFRLINIRNLESIEVQNSNIEQVSLAIPNHNLERHWLRKNDVLITTRTHPIRASVLSADLERGIAGQNLAVLRPKAGINPFYIAVLFHTQFGKNLAEPFFKSSSSIPLISIGNLRTLEIPVPSLERQQQIVDLVLAQERYEQIQQAEQIAKRRLIEWSIRQTLQEK
jgi:restriction endonuclease S subunit